MVERKKIENLKEKKCSPVKETSNRNKLKNKTSSSAAMRKKLRNGKAYTKETKEVECETSVGTKHLYSNKLHIRKVESVIAKDKGEGSSEASKALQKKNTRNQQYEKEQKRQRKSIVKKIAEMAEQGVSNLVKKVMKQPLILVMIAILFLVVCLIIGGISSCSLMGNGIQPIAIVTSFTAEDDQILAVEADYMELERILQQRVNTIEITNPGYDEYRYYLEEIGHNPFQLAALLTVLFEGYTKTEVFSTLQNIFNAQYTFYTEDLIEIRTRMEERIGYRQVVKPDGTIVVESYTYEEEVSYSYSILQVYVNNHTLEAVIAGFGLIEDQIQRYQVLLETKGNKAYLFEDNLYASYSLGNYQDYTIPAEALTHQRFANLIREAEKYLGYPYVWGGSSPSTSFDCSGFVSYVINQCGNGWNIGRQTANGLLGNCTTISVTEAIPGDLIFFQGTYNTRGASHVGIYVGNGMMLHCGNPIQYTSIQTTYWQTHFLCFGRIN